MKRLAVFLSLLFVPALFAQQAVPEIPFDSVPNFFKLPENLHFGEASGVAVEYKDVSFGIDRDSRRFPGMQILWKLEEVGDRIKRGFRHRLLSKQRGTEHQKHQSNEASHFVLPVRKPNANGPMAKCQMSYGNRTI